MVGPLMIAKPRVTLQWHGPGEERERYDIQYLDPRDNQPKTIVTQNGRAFAMQVRDLVQDALLRHMVAQCLGLAEALSLPPLPETHASTPVTPAREPQTGSLRLKDLWEKFVAARRGDLSPKAIVAYRTCYHALRGSVNEESPIRDISVFDAEQYAVCRMTKVKPVTVNKEIAHLKGIFGSAVRWGDLTANPFADLRRKKEDEPQVRVVSTAEEKGLLRAAGSVGEHRHERRCLKAIIQIAVQAGLRSGEVLNLRWQDVDLETGQVRITCREGWSSKARKDRVTFVMPRATRLLGAIKRSAAAQGDNIFPWHDSSKFARIFTRIAQAAAVPDVTMHDLRRTCATRLAEADVNPQVAMVFLGHATINVTMKYYVKVSNEALRNAMLRACRHAAKAKGRRGGSKSQGGGMN